MRSTSQRVSSFSISSPDYYVGSDSVIFGGATSVMRWDEMDHGLDRSKAKCGLPSRGKPRGKAKRKPWLS